MSDTGRTFQITLPRLQWRILYTWKFLAFLALLLTFAAGIYWWREVRPYTFVPGGVLQVATREILADEDGKIFDLLPGDLFQAGELLYSTQDASTLSGAKQIDQKLQASSLEIEDLKSRIDQNMQEYLYLQNEIEAQIGPTELTNQIWQEIQSLQEKLLALEQETMALAKERAELASQMVLAPFDGMVLQRTKQIGQRIKGGDKVLLICDKDKRWIEAEIDEKMLAVVRPGVPTRIEFSAFPGQKWDGEVSWVSPVVESGKIKIHCTADLLPLRPGLSAKTHLKIR
jgi:multidrug resistance efflux pump